MRQSNVRASSDWQVCWQNLDVTLFVHGSVLGR